VGLRLGFVPLGDRVFFPADDGRHGFEIWTSDGTEPGTRLVHDLNPLAGSSDPRDLFATDDFLAFIADDGISGSDLWTLAPTDPGPSCRPTTTSLCLQGGRFRAEAHWRDFRGGEGSGKTLAMTEDTGAFWFFREENVEVMLKVLDGRERNQHFWTFYGALSNVEYWLTLTDTETGLTRRYANPPRHFASVGDTRSFGPKGASLEYSPDPTAAHSSLAAEVASYQLKPANVTACAPSSERLCLGGGRFAVEVGWTDFRGNTGRGTAGDLTDDTGTFWFFRDTNIELALKILDGRTNNGHFWVFYGSLSNVDFDITVTDTETGQVKVYRNHSRQFASVGDTRAF
jgi:ELWxxDGT repeat protein